YRRGQRHRCRARVAEIVERGRKLLGSELQLLADGLVDHPVGLMKHEVVDRLDRRMGVFAQRSQSRRNPLRRKIQYRSAVEDEIDVPLDVAVLVLVGNEVLNSHRLAVATDRQDDCLIPAAVAVQIEVDRRSGWIELERGGGSTVREDWVLKRGALVTHQQQRPLDSAGRQHAANRIQTKRIAGASEVYVVRDRGDR